MAQPLPPEPGFRNNPVDPEVPWRAYVSIPGGSLYRTYDPKQGHTPDDVPNAVIMIFQMADETGEMDIVIGGENYVINHRGRWAGASDTAIARQIRNGTPFPVTKEGFWDDTQSFRFIVTQALANDEAFPHPEVKAPEFIQDVEDRVDPPLEPVE